MSIKMEKKIKSTWEIMQGKLSRQAQERVIKRVLEKGMTLNRAISSEGVMFLGGEYNHALVKKLCENGTIKFEDKLLSNKGKIHVQRADNTHYSQEKTDPSKLEFVPRPKN